MPDKAAEIFAKMQQAELHWFDPDRGSDKTGAACAVAKKTGFYQPWRP